MASKNYAIADYEQKNGEYIFLLRSCDDYQSVEEAMPANIQLDEYGNILRIEIVYLQDGLERLGKSLLISEPTSKSKIVLQVGDNTPVSFLLWIDALYRHPHSVAHGLAEILQSQDKEIVGLSVSQAVSTST